MKKIIAMMLCLILAGASLGCGSLAEGTSVNRDETLIVGTLTPFTGNFFDRSFGGTGSDWDVMNLLHGYSLVYWNNTEGKYEINPTVVANYQSSDTADGLQYLEFTLRPGLRYSDGTDITAKDYIFGALFRSSPIAKSDRNRITKDCFINGWEDYRNAYAQTFSGVHLLSDYKFGITIGKEFVHYFYGLSLMDWQPYPLFLLAPGCEVCDDGNGAYIKGRLTSEMMIAIMNDKNYGYATHPGVVSGSYSLVSYQDGVVELQINPYYEGDARGNKPSIKHIIIRELENDEVAFLLSQQDVDLVTQITNRVTISRVSTLRIRTFYNAVAYPRSGCSMFSISCERIATSEPAVRQAIACCIDKDALTKEYVGEFGERVDGYYGEGLWMVQMLKREIGLLSMEITEDMNESEKAAVLAKREKWSELTMDKIPVYPLSVEKAAELLDGAGWNLNEKGEPYQEGVRYKAFDENTLKSENKYAEAIKAGGFHLGDRVLVPLKLKCAFPVKNTIKESLQEHFINHLAQAGIELTIVEMPVDELLQQYYHSVERSVDMCYVAVNFATFFSPTSNFDPSASVVGDENYTALQDDELYSYAKGMGLTPPGDEFTYCQYWLKFQQRFQEMVPAIAVYTNRYFDIYTKRLKNYRPDIYLSWANAIISATLNPVSE